MPTRKYDPSALAAATRRRRRAMLGFASCTAGLILGFGYVVQVDYSSIQFFLGGFALTMFGVGWFISVVVAVAAGVDMDDQHRYRKEEPPLLVVLPRFGADSNLR